MSQKNILSIKNLAVQFLLDKKRIRALSSINLSIYKREILGIIGESGSGKSILALSILKLLPSNTEIKGEILFDQKNLINLSEKKLSKIRGKKIAWIPQNPDNSLNPLLQIGKQISESIKLHHKISYKQARNTTLALLELLQITPARQRINQYPFQYSGGMKQRALVAIGAATFPQLLIADEPTKGLDIVRKRETLYFLKKIKSATNASILLITHDLKFAEKICNRVAIMYCGEIIEISPASLFFNKPLHPYSIALLQALPAQGLQNIPGPLPHPLSLPKGCNFSPRCKFFTDKCLTQPPIIKIKNSYVKCWLYDNP
ncbi:peptide/nickel transport system ATP-binding protein [Desulfonauticus submarinus]|uniref:Nickel import system ATP-binding protein NikD n=1 Tax=Desulfonauticus submarinus TaxID=206665 RepID=A0A1H0BDF9_9BACT|nr:ABC transporter ATP-binding protein [Desulfonauticus submarinus]SDN43712.1 peptide/nickel transport system ATP-binding protein [Desulfonauticus submarinus]